MLLRILKLPWLAFRRGEIDGHRVTRNPIAWIPFFLGMPIVLLAWMLFIVVYIALLPIVLTWMYLWHRSFQKKAGVFSETGIHFPSAYRKVTIAWSEIREVIRELQPKVRFYSVVCGKASGGTREYVMCSTQDDKMFEQTLCERGIPFKTRDDLGRVEGANHSTGE